jgi:hypothetical protein
MKAIEDRISIFDLGPPAAGVTHDRDNRCGRAASVLDNCMERATAIGPARAVR